MPIGIPTGPYRLPGSTYEQWIDLEDRLFRERIIFLTEEVDDGIANAIVAYLLYLDSEDQSKP
ncbi:MAG: ATP-dependent Clp protease proteolytic subunit, partial [Dolichospermum sp.]